MAWAQRRIPAPRWGAGHVAYRRPTPRRRSWGAQVLLMEAQPVDGVRPVAAPGAPARVFPESGCLGMQPKAGGKLHLRLNTNSQKKKRHGQSWRKTWLQS